MKTYVRPEIEVTYYETEQIMLTSGVTQSTDKVMTVSVKDINF